MAFLPERSRLVVLFWKVEVPLLLAIWGDRPPGSAQDFQLQGNATASRRLSPARGATCFRGKILAFSWRKRNVADLNYQGASASKGKAGQYVYECCGGGCSVG